MSEKTLPESLPDGKVNIDVYFHNETLWLTQKLIAELFQKDRSVISKHLKNTFEEGELDERVVCANFAHTTTDERDEEVVCRKFRHTTQHRAIDGKSAIPALHLVRDGSLRMRLKRRFKKAAECLRWTCLCCAMG